MTATAMGDYDALTLMRKHADELREDLARIEDRIRRLEYVQFAKFQARAAGASEHGEGASMKLLLATLALACAPVGATTLGLHLATAHTRSGYCSVNPGLYVKADSGWIAGAYRNSRCDLAVYAGYAWEYQLAPSVSAGLVAAAVHGYGPGLKPLIAPSLAYNVTPRDRLRLTFGPKVRPMRASFVHLSLEHSYE